MLHVHGSTYVIVAELPKQGDLSQNALGVDKIVESSGDLLDGHLLPVLGVEGGYHHAVGTVPYWLDQLVLRVDLWDEGKRSLALKIHSSSSVSRRVRAEARSCASSSDTKTTKKSVSVGTLSWRIHREVDFR